VNVKTIRNAVALLEAEGLVTPVRRRGTVVRERPVLKRLGVDRYAKSKWKYGETVAFGADREASGRSWQPTDQTQAVDLVPASARTAEILDLEVGEPVYRRSRLIKDHGHPTHTLTSYYRRQDVANTPLVDPTPGPAGRGGGFAVLTLQGLEPHTITETFHARMPSPDEITALELPAGEPVMVLERITRTQKGLAVEHAEGVHAASRFAWTYTYPMPE
jgi:GntR family transcriptional regulator